MTVKGVKLKSESFFLISPGVLDFGQMTKFQTETIHAPREKYEKFSLEQRINKKVNLNVKFKISSP